MLQVVPTNLTFFKIFSPFLHEKDLDESKGGTKGFDADKANEELRKAQEKYEEESKDKMEE